MSDDKWYIVIAPFSWGRAKRDREAFTNCAGEVSLSYCKDPVPFGCYEVSKKTFVNEMGGFTRPNNDPEPRLIWEKKVPKRFIKAFNDAEGALRYGDEKHEIQTTYHNEDGTTETW